MTDSAAAHTPPEPTGSPKAIEPLESREALEPTGSAEPPGRPRNRRRPRKDLTIMAEANPEISTAEVSVASLNSDTSTSEPSAQAPDAGSAIAAASVRDVSLHMDMASDEPLRARLATAEELESWDERVVASPNGHVFQSRAWAEYCAAHGWRTWPIAFNDGFRLLVLGRPRLGAGGGSAYASRGPIPEASPEHTVQRAAAAAELLASEGQATLTVDGETPASTGLGELLAGSGFEPTEQLGSSCHRMDVQLGPDDVPNSDEKTIFASFGATTRNLILQADRHGLRVKRVDAGGGRAEEEAAATLDEEFDPVDLREGATIDEMLRAFYRMVDASEKRRAFAQASEDAFLDWSRRGIAAGHMVYLQAEHPLEGPIAGAAFYRHGHRLTYSMAGDRVELRRKYPGAARLLVWRGIQIALDERRTSVDLGGIDAAGAREKPDKGDPTYGLYQFKESFGARWVELTGAHQRATHRRRFGVGRVAGVLRRLGRRRAGR